MNKHSFRGRHNRIAVLGAEVNEAYQSELWKGICDEAEKYSKQLICFFGSRDIVFPLGNGKDNSIYPLAHSGSFDGIIVVTSTIATYLEPLQIQRLFVSRPSLPKISIGLQLPGVGSVCVDGTNGMKKVVEHMVAEHGRREFAIVAGPRWHPESEERRTTILRVLKEYKISVHEERILYGSFDKNSGRTAIREIMKKSPGVDSVFCLNDLMAIGVIEELACMGISVPHMVSVCGFDGIEESAYCSPPLTTVSQPLYQVGITAVQELYRLLDGEEVRNVTLTSEPVIRMSCTCRPRYNSGGEIPAASYTINEDIDSFLDEVEESIASSIVNQDDILRLEQKLTSIEKNLCNMEAKWFDIVGSARKALWEYRQRYLINLRIQKKYRSDLLRAVVTSLTGAFELPELLECLAEGLLKLGFRHGFLVLYIEDSGKNDRSSRLVFTLENGTYIHSNYVDFRYEDVLPTSYSGLEVDDCSIWMFTPLLFQKKALGHMILPGTYPDTEIYETLTRQVASSFQGAMLLEQVRSHELSLMKEVKKRTKELQVVNKDLRKEVRNRMRLEQEVIDISKHLMEKIGQDLHDDLCQHLAGISLHVTALRRKIESKVPEVVPTTFLIGDLLSNSVSRARRIVRGLLPFGMVEEGLSSALEILCRETADSFDMAIKYDGDVCINELTEERALELYRIIQEALNNSVKHSGGSFIEVKILTERVLEQLRFSAIITDNGHGFENTTAGDGMGLKIMKYRGEKADIQVSIQSAVSGTQILCTGVQRNGDG